MADELKSFFKASFGEEVEAIVGLRPHASNRRIFRLRSQSRSVIGVQHDDRRENLAFIEFTKHFRSHGLPVPEVFAVDLDRGMYLEEDFGDLTLLDFLTRGATAAGHVSEEAESMYLKAVEILPLFQIKAGLSVPYEHAFPTKVYDRKSMLWDMLYFRDGFLRRTGVQWQAALLDKDFQKLADFLSEADHRFFLYRDFQARNIMVRPDGELGFIDYQGGRKGALQWDLVSLLFQSKAALPAAVRDRLLNRYLEVAQTLAKIDRPAFLKYLHGFLFIRLMQVLGTYGEKGLGEKKEYFIASLPLAIRNLKSLLDIAPLPFTLPTLMGVCEQLVKEFEAGGSGIYSQPLTLEVHSFSYRNGMPVDSYEHGGGFVFDCRCLPNPGRETQYRDLTGVDPEVIAYFQSRTEVEQFLQHAYAIVEQAIGNYLSRGFVRLSVFFGCTGGQHRSVYCTEKLAAHIEEKFRLKVNVHHLQMAISFPEKLRR